MADSSSVDVILDFLQRNRFTRAEAALPCKLDNHPDLNGFFKNLTIEEKDSSNVLEEENRKKIMSESKGSGSRNSGEASKELIVKEIECGTDRNGSESKWRNAASTGEHNKPNESVVRADKSFTFSKSSVDNLVDLPTWSFNPSNGNPYNNDSFGSSTGLSDLQIAEKTRYHKNEALDNSKTNEKFEEVIIFTAEKKTSWLGNSSKANLDSKYDSIQASEAKELDQQGKASSIDFKEQFAGNNAWSRSEEPSNSSSDVLKDCSVKTVFPFPKGDASTSCGNTTVPGEKEGKRKADITDVRAVTKEQVDEVGRALYFGKSQGMSEHKNLTGLTFPPASDNSNEELPRLPPVKLKSEDKSVNVNWEEKQEHDGLGPKLTSADNAFLIGSYLDVPVGQEMNSSGGKRTSGGSWLSVSQGIAEDTSDLVSGFASIGDGLSESVDYPNEYWDSDEYDDDDDVGYMRQPIEDEAWFLAHETDYPSDNEKGTGHGSAPDPQERGPTKVEDDDQSFAEEDSYFSGEQYFQRKTVEPVTDLDDPVGLSVPEMYRRGHENDLIAQYDGQLMDEEELNLMSAEPVWQGFVTQTNELIMLGNGKVLNECGRSQLDDVCIDDDQHGSVRSIGVGINSDATIIGSEVHESLVGGSSEGDLEYFCDQDVAISGSKKKSCDIGRKHIDKSRDTKKINKHDSNKYVVGNDRGRIYKSLWSNNCNAVSDENDNCLNALPLMGSDDMLAIWRWKSSDSSTVKSYRDENNANALRSANSFPSSFSNYGYGEREHAKKEDDRITGVKQEAPGASVEAEEAAAVQEQVRQIKAQEEEFETFNLKIVHRKNRTGFEEDKNFHVVLNSIIAGCDHVTEYLGSAAFSKAIQAHDLHTGMDVCVKIIKNNKDFFYQSLDEIKLLKYVYKHDPTDKCHILRLYDYFYYREHLLIVCKLLKANLYEFHKFNRELVGEVYFTMPRLQSIAIQCLKALQFLHGLGLIHCDLKPENILVKSYSRCEVNVIDLGGSCFETDHLWSYVQSRSYRAPGVILGLPYDKKIDIWSLGYILAELCTGNVLFQNDSSTTLLARVIAIICPIDQDMLAKGRGTYKYFTKNHMLYERNQETNRLEYLILKRTSLRHHLPMGDQGFIDFVAHLLKINPKKRPTTSEALKHPWLSYPYEPMSA
ncbi:hypothetical protein SLE2022_347090 [Rubroshorea leprosula]